jgi:hypothetical protein
MKRWGTDNQSIPDWFSLGETVHYYPSATGVGHLRLGDAYGNPSYVSIPGGARTTTTVLGFRYMYVSGPLSTTWNQNNFVFLRDSAANVICQLQLTATGSLMVKDHTQATVANAGTGLLDTADPTDLAVVLFPGTGANGTIDVYADGQLIISETGLDFTAGNDDFASVQVGNGDNSGIDRWNLYEVWWADSADHIGRPANDGNVPTGDGNTTAWSTSTGTTHYTLVDEDTYDGADYVQGATEGDIELFTFDDFTNVDTVAGVMVSGYFQLPDGGSRYVRPVVRISSTNYTPLSSVAVPTAGRLDFIIDQDPSTASAWTVAGVNAAEFGFEVRDS